MSESNGAKENYKEGISTSDDSSFYIFTAVIKEEKLVGSNELTGMTNGRPQCEFYHFLQMKYIDNLYKRLVQHSDVTYFFIVYCNSHQNFEI